MYAMGGRNRDICRKCSRPSCLHPAVCPNLYNDHRPLLDIYREVDRMPVVKKSFIGSGVRYDLAMARNNDENVNAANREYLRTLIADHVSGRLKVAPEHTSDAVLQCMRKPEFEQFRKFKRIFRQGQRRKGLEAATYPLLHIVASSMPGRGYG